MIATFNRIYGQDVTAKLIFAMLEDLNNYFNVQRPMTEGQMTDLSIEISTLLNDFRIQEILAFGEAMKKGTYGKIFERFDPSVIWEQLRLYTAARSEFFVRKASEHRQYDPVIIDEDESKIRKGMANMSGAMSQITKGLKQKFGK